MRRAARAVTIIVQPDGTTASQTYRLPLCVRGRFIAAAALAAWLRAPDPCFGRPRGCQDSRIRWPGSKRLRQGRQLSAASTASNRDTHGARK
jgi:hypothetical protein